MNTKNIMGKMFNKRAKDYSFTILFFIIFSFFGMFVIKPNVSTVFELQTQLVDLRKLDKDYELAIFNIINIQSALEKHRQSFPLLSQAIPSTPQVNKVIDDIRNVASESGITLSKVDISKINLKESKNKNNVKPYTVNIETSSGFVSVNKFVNELMKQRRLKSIKSLSITKGDSVSTDSGNLRIQLEIEGFYL